MFYFFLNAQTYCSIRTESMVTLQGKSWAIFHVKKKKKISLQSLSRWGRCCPQPVGANPQVNYSPFLFEVASWFALLKKLEQKFHSSPAIDEPCHLRPSISELQSPAPPCCRGPPTLRLVPFSKFFRKMHEIVSDSRRWSGLPEVYRLNLRHFLLSLVPAEPQLLEPHVVLLSGVFLQRSSDVENNFF